MLTVFTPGKGLLKEPRWKVAQGKRRHIKEVRGPSRPPPPAIPHATNREAHTGTGAVPVCLP